ncbi:response regulator [Cohnella caldifontis]|uniref:response regulator n=1 Tax=Cohnella caldifontis TaxID=3027471 RepID=UPI0023EC9648|nr:response regulator [Cohnella sp. YIM B05605]
MIRVMIVEDEKPILDLMDRLVSRHPALEVAGAFVSPLEALDRAAELKPDAAFLDVEMPKMGGIQLAEKLKALDDEMQIVFTTAYPDYAVDAFRVSAVDYLLKPVTPDALERIVARLAKNHARRSAPQPVREPEGGPFVRCLGTFETRGRDGTLVNWPTRKTEELFAYFLAYPKRQAGKWQLADLLWPDLDEDRGLHNVHNTVYRLKKTLKDAGIEADLQLTNEGYRLQMPPEFSDLEQVRSYMDRTDAIDERNAAEGLKLLRSCTGSLYAGKDYLWSVGMEIEVSAELASLCRMLTKHYLGVSDRTSAKETLRFYLSAAPLHEDLTRELLQLYAEDGETEPFRTLYGQYAARMESELGVEPSEEIREMAARFLNHRV